ncbi:MAG: hypothetical protein V3T58_05530 [Candidatus Hydrothermarchaeales archaeon]
MSDYVARLTVFQRIQHIAVFLTFFLLVVTGMPLKYPQAWWSIEIVKLLGGLANRALLHRIAGVGIIVVGLVHIFYYLIIDRAPLLRRPIMFTPKDIFDMLRSIGYAFRLTNEPPRMGRYTWGEKMEYWSVAWGTSLIAATGLVMWFKEIALQYITLPIFQLFWMLHSYEALLATLTVFFGHFYTVHYSPRFFPGSLIFLHGRMEMEEMEEMHPLELEEIEREKPELIEHKMPMRRIQGFVYALNRRIWALGIVVFLIFIAMTVIAFVDLFKYWFIGV